MGKKSISIKEGNEGKFGAFARSVGMSVQEAARHVLANKDRYSGARVKQANFARNAAKWKKQDGGVVRSDDRWRMTDDSAAPIVDGVAPGGLLLQKRFIDDAMARMERSNFSGVVPSARMPTQAEIIEAQRKDAVKKEQAKALAAYQQQHATDFKKLVPRPQPVDNLAPDMGQQRFFEQYLNNAGSIPFSQGQVRDEDQQFQEALRLSRDARKDAELARRAKAIETADEVKKIDFFSPSKWTRENLAKAAQGLGERGRIFTDDVDGSLNWFDEHLNPLMQIGKWAKKMGEAPLDAQRTNSIVPYLTAIGTPLLYRAIGSRPFEATIPFARNALAAQTFNDHLRNIWQHGVVDSGKDVATDWVVDHAQAAIDKGLEGKRMGGENGEWRMGNGELEGKQGNGEWRMGNGVVGENTNNGSNSQFYGAPYIFPRRMAKGGSIVDFLGRQGVDPSFGNRKQLFGEHFNEAYRGTADQNTRFLELLQSQSQAPQPEEVGSGQLPVAGREDDQGQRIVGSGQLPVAGRQGDGAAEGEKFNPFFNTEEDRDAYEKRLGEVANRALWWGDDSDYLKYTSYHPKADGNDCINGICGLNLKAGLTYSHPTDEDRYLGNTKFTDNLHKGMEDYYQTYQPRVGTHLQKLDDKGVPFHSMLVYKIDRDDKGRPSKYHVIHNGGDTKFVEKVFSPEDMQEELHPSDRKDPYMLAWNPGKHLDRDKLAKERMGKAPFPYNQSEEEVQRYFGDTNLPTQFSLKEDPRGLTPDSPLYYLSGKDVKDQSRNELLSYLNDKDLDKQLRERLRIDDVTLQNLKPYIFGIMGVESNDQNISAGRDIKERVAKLVKSDPSLGPFQIRLGSVGDRARKAFDIYEQDDLSKDLRKGYIAAVDRMLEAKRVMDDRVAKGYHPELAKADPYARATYYYNQPQRALMSDEDYAQKNFVYQPFTIPNPVGKDWRFSTAVNASPDDVKSAYQKYLEQSRLKGDRGSYMHQVMKAAYPLNMEVLDDEEPQFGIADAQLPAVEVVGRRKKKMKNGGWRMENGEMRDNSQFSIFNSQFSTGGYKADSPDRFRAFNVIPSGQITMQGVPHPVMGVDNLGYRQLMMPGAEYRFPGQAVLEMPVRGRGQMTDDRWQMTGGSPAQVRQAGGPVDESLTQPVDKIPTAPVDETKAQLDYILSLAQSKKSEERLRGENGGKDVKAQLDARIQSFLDTPLKYSRDLASWQQGAYVPRQYRGNIYNEGWKPAKFEPNPIFGLETPGTLYLSPQFQPGKIPAAKDATTPAHEGAHSLLDGDTYLTDKAISMIHGATSETTEPQVQLNGMTFGYGNAPSEMISRMQAVRYLLNKNNLYDARTQNFTNDVYDKMMNDPMIQNNSDFQDFYKALRGDAAEKKRHFMQLMNEIASRGSGSGSTMARYGGMIERETERGRGRYQDGGALTYQAPEGYAPSTPEQRANWNQFLNYMESQGIAGSADLDARDKRLGLQYLNTYNKAYPKAQVQESFIPTAQYENYLIRRENRFPTMTKEQSEMAFNGLSPAYKQYPLSGVDNWLGRFTSKQFYPTFRSGTAIHKADGTEQVDSYNFGENFEDYVQSKGDPNVAKKYLVKQPAPMAVRQLGGGVKTKRETERERGRYQVGGGYDPTGFLGAGNINPFNANPYFTPTYAVPVAPAAAPGVAAGAPGMAGPIPGFQNFMQQNQVLSKSNPFATDIGPGDSEFDITKMGPIPGFREFMKKKTILSKDNQNPFGVNAPFADPKPTKPTTETSWGPNIGAAGAAISGMSLLNRALESGDRNRYIGQQRIRNLGDNKGPYLSGNLGYVRGDYSLNEGDFRPDRKVPIQFGVAQMGGSIFSEPDVNVPVMEAPERNGEWGMENGELGMENGRGNRGMENGERVNPNQAAQSAFDYYIDHRGLAPHIAAGIIGNLYQESGLQPDVKEKGNTGNGRGIAQWDVRDRWKSLHKWAEKNQRDPYDLYTQLDYILDEPGEGAKVLKALEKAQTPEEAAKIFGRVYERPSEKYANWGVRTGVARSLYAGSYSGSGGADNAGADNAGPNNAGQEYREGGEYEVSEEEVRRILREGGEVEYL